MQDQDQEESRDSSGLLPRCEARRTSKKPETSSSILGPDHCRQIRRLYRSFLFLFSLALPPATFVGVIIDRYIDLRRLLLELFGHVRVSWMSQPRWNVLTSFLFKTRSFHDDINSRNRVSRNFFKRTPVYNYLVAFWLYTRYGNRSKSLRDRLIERNFAFVKSGQLRVSCCPQ